MLESEDCEGLDIQISDGDIGVSGKADFKPIGIVRVSTFVQAAADRYNFGLLKGKETEK